MLTMLALRHAKALEVLLRDFDSNPDELHGYFSPRDAPIGVAVDDLAAWARGERLPDGWVPCSTWFWEAEGVLQGVINVRHRLSPSLRELGGHIGYSVAPTHRREGVATAMLAAVLPKCRELGLQRVLLTVDSENEPSWRAVERNGGVLEKEAPGGVERSLQRWYWIDLERDVAGDVDQS